MSVCIYQPHACFSAAIAVCCQWAPRQNNRIQLRFLMQCVDPHSVWLTILESTVSSPEMIAGSFASDGDDELHKFRVLRDSFSADCDMLRVFFFLAK